MKRARTQEAKEERKHALLDAALDEFFERGFDAARMDDIAARANLSKGTLYLYFDSKEALFHSLVETIAIPNIEAIEEAANSTPTFESAIRTMMALAPKLLRTTNMPKLMKVITANATIFPETAKAFRKNVPERVLDAIAKLLRRAHEAGEISVNDPDLTARLVVAPIVFSTMWHFTFEDDPEAQVDHEKLFALHADMLLRALTTGTETSP
jgi:AcrR family transcriptional regulator